jgi:hypothetical protein
VGTRASSRRCTLKRRDRTRWLGVSSRTARKRTLRRDVRELCLPRLRWGQLKGPARASLHGGVQWRAAALVRGARVACRRGRCWTRPRRQRGRLGAPCGDCCGIPPDCVGSGLVVGGVGRAGSGARHPTRPGDAHRPCRARGAGSPTGHSSTFDWGFVGSPPLRVALCLCGYFGGGRKRPWRRTRNGSILAWYCSDDGRCRPWSSKALGTVPLQAAGTHSDRTRNPRRAHRHGTIRHRTAHGTRRSRCGARRIERKPWQ